MKRKTKRKRRIEQVKQITLEQGKGFMINQVRLGGG